MDITQYTEDEVRKNLALLENHLKQAPFSDQNFCEECINKHILILEGLSEEGFTACLDCDTGKFEMVLKFINEIKDKNYQKQGIDFAKQARRLRKIFIPCEGDSVGMKDRDDVNEKIKELEEELKLSKDDPTKDRLSYAIYICNWFLHGRKCSDV